MVKRKLGWSFQVFTVIRVFLTIKISSVNHNLGMRRMSKVDDQIVILLSAICS
jgi:hypothetical protein